MAEAEGWSTASSDNEAMPDLMDHDMAIDDEGDMHMVNGDIHVDPSPPPPARENQR
jgi:hypothetical protein